MRDFDERLMKAETSDEVKKLKLWMFQEQVKIQAKKDELDELSHKLQEEKKAVNNQRNDVSIRIEINTGALENIKANLNVQEAADNRKCFSTACFGSESIGV